MCVYQEILIAARDSYLVDCRMTDILSPYSTGAFLQSHTFVVAPATLHKGRGGETLAAGLEVFTAQPIQRDLGDLGTKGMEIASRGVLFVCHIKLNTPKIQVNTIF